MKIKRNQRRIIRLGLVLVTGLSLLTSWQPVQAAAESPSVKELNLVFLPGLAGSNFALQLLSDKMIEQSADYISEYEKNNPGVKVKINILARNYPNNVDIEPWANNIADTVDKYLPNKNNLILIGHSMGGKSALYAVAKNVKKLGDRVAMVVTINSPVRSLNQYYFAGGISMSDFFNTRLLADYKGGYHSIAGYDSSEDGKWVGTNKHWLAFISAESAPQSPQFDFGRFDPLPRDMDDGIVPISAQYSDQADILYYGEHGHGEFSTSDQVAGSMAESILSYIFGGTRDYSVFLKSGTLEHRAGWLPLSYHWEHVTGNVVAGQGQLTHTNDSFFKGQVWEDILVGRNNPLGVGSGYEVKKTDGLPLLTGIQELGWLSSAPEDFRVYVRTMAAPLSTIALDWRVYQYVLLPAGTTRSHYELKVLSSAPFTSLSRASWATDDRRDTRLSVSSEAQGPLRSVEAEWRVYSTESRYRKIIDEIPLQAAPALP